MSKSTQKQRVPRGDHRGGFRQEEAAPRVGLSARVSTHDQQTLPLPLSARRAYAKPRGWAIVLKVEDVGSGVRERPKREDLLRAAQRRELDLILVWRLDRGGRSLVDLVTTLQERNALQVVFVSLSEALDLTTPSGRAFRDARRLRRVRAGHPPRSKAGIDQARKDGRRHGRPRMITKDSAEVRKLFREGVSKREIARKIGISRASVRHLPGDGIP